LGLASARERRSSGKELRIRPDPRCEVDAVYLGEM
jgi:hypothetical protein